MSVGPDTGQGVTGGAGHQQTPEDTAVTRVGKYTAFVGICVYMYVYVQVCAGMYACLGMCKYLSICRCL